MLLSSLLLQTSIICREKKLQKLFNNEKNNSKLLNMIQEKISSRHFFAVADNVWGMKDVFVNLYMVKSTESDKWFLVDAGLKTSLSKIKRMATSLFGDKKPAAIILTHGHFDHVGSLKRL